MNRRLVSCALAVTVVVGLAGCSGGSNQSVADACASLNEPLSEVVTVLQDTSNSLDTDPQGAVDAWTQLAVTFGTLTATVSNTEVKEALDATRQDVAAVRDVLQQLVDGDTTSEASLEAAKAEMQESLSSLASLCQS